MIIDCHAHSWRYPEHFNKEVMLLNQPPRRKTWTDEKFKLMWDLPIEDYLKEAEGVVDKSILLALRSWHTLGVDIPNDYCANLVKQYPDRLEWCCCVIPTEEGAVQEVERCVKELGAIGLGELGPSYGNYYADDKKCYPVWEKAMELGVPIIIHAGPSVPRMLRMKQSDVLAVDDIAIDFPDLKIVIAHIGYYKYEDASFLIQKHENVYGDVSWLGSLAGLDRRGLSKYLPVVQYPYFHLVYPLLYSLTQTFGDTDKLIWGTDWSATSPRRAIEILTSINDILKEMNMPPIPEQTIHNILHENWKKVFTKLAEKVGGK